MCSESQAKSIIQYLGHAINHGIIYDLISLVGRTYRSIEQNDIFHTRSFYHSNSMIFYIII